MLWPSPWRRGRAVCWFVQKGGGESQGFRCSGLTQESQLEKITAQLERTDSALKSAQALSISNQLHSRCPKTSSQVADSLVESALLWKPLFHRFSRILCRWPWPRSGQNIRLACSRPHLVAEMGFRIEGAEGQPQRTNESAASHPNMRVSTLESAAGLNVAVALCFDHMRLPRQHEAKGMQRSFTNKNSHDANFGNFYTAARA